DGQIVVHVDRLDANCPADAGNAAIDGRGEGVAVEPDLAPCQGATQRAVHSAGDGGHDVVQGRGDRRPLLGAVVVAQLALHSVDHGLRDLAQECSTVPVAVLQTRVRDVFEVLGHRALPYRSDVDGRPPATRPTTVEHTGKSASTSSQPRD